MGVNNDLLNGIISGLSSMPKKSEIDTPTHNIDLDATETESGLMSAADKKKLNKISEDGSGYKLPIATKDTLGGVKTASDIDDVTGLTPVPIIDGIPYYNSMSEYELPIASDTILGGIKIGDNITIAEDGTISVSDVSADKMTGILPITKGGTGADNANKARLNLRTSCFAVAGNITKTSATNGGYYEIFTISPASSTKCTLRLLLSSINALFEDFVVYITLNTLESSKDTPVGYITSVKEAHSVLANLLIACDSKVSTGGYTFWYKNPNANSAIRLTVLQCIYSGDTVNDGIQLIPNASSNTYTAVDTIPISTPNVVSFADIVDTQLASSTMPGYMSAEDKTKLDDLQKSVSSAITSTLNPHINNKDNPHEVTAEQIGLGNVENKSSATIRGEISKANVTNALGYTPVKSTTYDAVITTGTKIGSLDVDGTTTDIIIPENIDTHYTTKLVVGAANTSNENEASINGGIYLNLFDDDIIRNSHKISGSNGITVSSTSAGNITISGTTYSSLKNPYSLNLQFNGVDQIEYDGSKELTLNITPDAIGASASDHEHDYLPLTGGSLTGQLKIIGDASASHSLMTQGIIGSDGNGKNGPLYLQYGTNSVIYLGNKAGYTISADGGKYSGTSTSATKLTASAGSLTQPIYFEDGVPVATSHTLEKSVPADAVFTDTLYDDSDIRDLISQSKSSVYYAECDIGSDIAEKTVECDGFVLEKGAIIVIKFTNTSTTSNPTSGNITLAVNTNDPKEIIRGDNGSTMTYAYGAWFRSNRTDIFIYNGAQFTMLPYDNNTTYSPMSLGFGYGTCTTVEATVAKVVTLASYALVKNGMISVKFTYKVPANATMNINSCGAKNIFYRGSKIVANIIGAGDIATFVYDGTQYQLISIDNRDASTVNGHTVATDVPENAKFTDTNTTYTAGTGLSLSGTKFNHKNSITAGTVKGDDTKILDFGDTFNIPTISYDSEGHITAADVTTMTLPKNPGDTKVTNTLATTTKAYVTGTTSDTTNTGTQIFDTGVYLDTTAGRLSATSFSENGQLLSNKYLPYYSCVVGQSSPASDPWFKVAEITLSGSGYVNYDHTTTFKVFKGYGDRSTACGILTAHIRTTSEAKFLSGELKWEYAGEGITLEDFKLAYLPNTTPIKAEIWVKIPDEWAYYHFVYMSAGNRVTSFNGTGWSLKSHGGDGVAAITDGYSTIDSTLLALKNPTAGGMYLPTAGGAMTGNISYKGTNATFSMIRFMDNTKDAYGNGISIGGGGFTVIGSGESATLMQDSYYAGEEKILICGDNAIDFYSNCNDGKDTTKHYTMDKGVIEAETFNATKSYKINDKVAIQYDSDAECVNFVFN